MAHRSETAFVGAYDSVSAASADFEAVTTLHESGATDRLEAAVVARAATGALTFERHARLGGVHVAQGPTDELKRIAEEVVRGSVVLLVISAEGDARLVAEAASHADSTSSHGIEQFSLEDGAFAGGGTPNLAEGDAGTGFTDGQVGELGV